MKLSTIFVLTAFVLASQTTHACDESCKREQAMKELSVSFPSYLTWEYCDGLKHDFMSNDVNRLQSYSTEHFSTKYKGPIKNIIQLIDQRKAWLTECDAYTKATKAERIFYDKKTTDAVFAQMEAIKKELNDVLDGVRYSSSSGDETQKIVQERFENLFVSLDDHKNLMHLKGKYVYQ